MKLAARTACKGGSQFKNGSDKPGVIRFWSKVDRSAGLEACWPWTACQGRGGYGHFQIGSERMRSAHSVALEFAVGPKPEGLIALHTCDNRACCNPRHLYWGTYQDNSNDAIARNRVPNGEKHCHAKFTDAQIVEFLSAYSALRRDSTGKPWWGEVKRLREKYGISERHASNIGTGRWRKHARTLAS